VGKLDQIVNYRYTYRLPTLITSNTLDLSPRIVSRCREGVVVILKGPDYRAQKKEGKKVER
jgi:DNA replication protein DnaC